MDDLLHWMWLAKMPKEETIGIMDVKGGAFYFFMFCYFSCVFFVCNLWVLVCVFHGMPTPRSRTCNGDLFSGFSFIVKMRMRRRDWQCTWWWTGINTKRQRKLSTLGFRPFFFDFMFLVLLLWVLGRMLELNHVDVLPFSFINSATLRLIDTLPSHGVKPTWGFHKVKLRKVELGSTLPASNSRKG